MLNLLSFQGGNILSLAPNNNVAIRSGTSMAAPHVAGVIANILSRTNNYDDPAVMKTYLKITWALVASQYYYDSPNFVCSSTKNAIIALNPTTPNELLYFDCNVQLWAYSTAY